MSGISGTAILRKFWLPLDKDSKEGLNSGNVGL